MQRNVAVSLEQVDVEAFRLLLHGAEDQQRLVDTESARDSTLIRDRLE